MCGVTGFLFDPCRLGGTHAEEIVRDMAGSICHRGPDASGMWVDDAAGMALGHRRLSIIDLSPQGDQPMRSASGRYVIAFNGEIYNFKEVRAALDSCPAPISWRGHSDTEVMLAAIERWGVTESVTRFNGMFAFALWDRETRTLHLARDRVGEKPLYYGWLDGAFVFGSELRALRHHPDWRAEIDPNALALYMRHNYVPSPYSIYKGINKLPPGTILTLPWGSPGARRPHRIAAYWSAGTAARAGIEPRRDEDAEQMLDELLRSAVALRMQADVPLGAFLSGGVDSSTVVALMQSQSAQPVRTFSIGFAESRYDEAQYARAVARHLGTAHTELYVSPAEALSVIPRLPELYDEPFADSSQIPTYLVSALARQGVTVALSGDGGDELFGGYDRYEWGRRIWRAAQWVPQGLRSAAARGLRGLSPEVIDGIATHMSRFVPARLRVSRAGHKARKLADVLGARDRVALYRALVTHWDPALGLVRGGVEPETPLTRPSEWDGIADFSQLMMYLDLVTYLPDDILVKVDRASMAVGLEARVPLLDHRIVEFAWQLPLHLKIRNGTGKWLLRRVLDRYVPRTLIERPKMGFAVPIAHWLRGPLLEWADALLTPEALRSDGLLDESLVSTRWAEHRAGKRDWSYHLWDVLMFQAWHEHQRAEVRVAP